MSKSEHVPVVILGGGLTGLSAGLECERRTITYRVLEKSDRVGGHAVTTEENGYRFDRTGHLLHLRSEALKNEVLDWLEGDCVSIERCSVVFSHGATTRYPFQSNTLGLPPEVAYECLMGFLSTLSAPKPGTPRNFEEFCLAHFGPGFSRHFMLPYNTKLWGVPACEITPAWCQRFVPIPKLEDVIAGAVGLADRKLGYNANFWYPEDGIGAFTSALAERTPLELARAPRSIDLAQRELVFDDDRVGFDVLLSTIPLPALIDLLSEVPEPVREARARLRSTHLFYFDLGLSVPNPNPYHWIYVPEAKYPFYRVGCYSHFSDKLTPAGKSNLYVELVERRSPTSQRALEGVVSGLMELGLLRSAADIELWRLRRIDHAYVIYDHAYRAALDVIEPFLKQKRILSAGRYGAWNYSSMEDALLMGKRAAADATELCATP